jgi:hypothetical protein
MKIIDRKLYLTFQQVLDCGIASEAYLWKAKSAGTKCWEFINDPADKRKVLIGYEALKDEHKEKVQKRFGNPYEYVAKEPIKALVQKDYKAEEHFLAYRYDETKQLSIEHVNKYTTAASWLNMLVKCDADKQFIKKTLNLRLDEFYANVADVLEAESVDLPTSYKRLRACMDRYRVDGYDSLIDSRFGNKRAAKIGKVEGTYDEEIAAKQEAIIRHLKSKHNNFDAAQITRAANFVFQQQGWQEISHSTVKQFISKIKHITTPGSAGKRVYDSTLAMQVKRKRPEFPLYYFTLDGWTVELLYQDENGYDNRLVMVVVLDAMNNYPVGYAIGDRENTELIKQANRNAILHIEQLFGQPYRPLQIQSDHYAIKSLTPFYEAMGKLFTPASVGNAKSKVIEPYFNSINKKYFQFFKNWSGHNVTASKKNQPNTEMLDKIKKEFPTKEGVIRQIELVMQQERKSKVQQYMQQFELMPEADKKVLDRHQWLMVFGKPHTHKNSITGAGLIATLEGFEITYDSFNPLFRANQHLKWQLVYDEHNLNDVLAISPDNKLQIVLQKKHEVAMDIRSTTAEDRLYLQQISGFNAARKEEIIQTYIEDAQVVAEVIGNTSFKLDDHQEAVHKLMFTGNDGQQKERIQDAKKLKSSTKKAVKVARLQDQQSDDDWNTLQLEYLKEQNPEFNQYLD